MGVWGYYDDENDTVADEAVYVEEMILPPTLQKCPEGKVEWQRCRRAQQKYMREHMPQVSAAILDRVRSGSKRDQVLVGLL